MVRSDRLRAALVAGLAPVFAMGMVACGGSKLVITTTITPTNPPADGMTPANISIKVTQGGQPVPDANAGVIELTVNQGQFGAYSTTTPCIDDPSQQNTSNNLTLGVAGFQLFSCHAGTSVIQINYTDSTGVTQNSTASVHFGAVADGGGPVPASIQFVMATNLMIGLQGSSGNTTSQIQFQVNDSMGNPDPGVPVNFTISPPSSGQGSAVIAPLSAVSDSNGLVSTTLTSGSTPESVVITATAAGTNPPVAGQSQSIGIGGGIVNQANFSFSCDNNYIGGFQDNGLSMNCTVFASDQSDAYVPNTQITIMTEAGSVPASVPTVESTDPATAGQGTATFNYTTGCPWPADVAPNQDEIDFPGNTEYSRADSGFFDACSGGQGKLEYRTVNPRDGWADMVAYTIGENCGQLGDGGIQPQCDIGEPFVDINDNGSYDGPNSPNLAGTSYYPTGEPFFDYNKDGVWTPPDHKWHAQAAIWKDVKVKWSGTAFPLPLTPIQNTGNTSPGLTTTDPAGSCNGQGCGLILPNEKHDKVCQSSMCSDPNGCGPSYYVIWADTNGNCPASDNSGDNVTLSCNGDCSDSNTIPLQDCQNFPISDDPKYPGLHAFKFGVTCADCSCLSSPPCPASGEGWQHQLVFTRTLDETVGTQEQLTLGVSGSFNN